jgi:hypothetical protein
VPNKPTDPGYKTAADLFAIPSGPKTPLQSMATTAGPTAPLQTDPQQREHPGMQPSPLRVAVDTVLGTAGAMMAPEALVGGVVSRFAPELIAAGSQLLTRGLGAGLGLAASGEAFSSPNETPGEAWARRRFDVASGVIAEGAGAGLTQLTKGVVGAVPAGRAFLERMQRLRRQQLEPDVPAIQEGLTKRGGTLQPGQMTTNPLTDWTQNILEATITSQGVMARAKAGNIDAAMTWVNEAAPRIADLATPRQAGELVDQLARDPLMGQKKVVRGAYRDMDREIASAGLPPSIDLTPQLQNFEGQFKMRIAKGDPDALRIRNYLNNPHPLTFDEADEIRGMLLDMGRKSGPDVSPTLRKVAGGMAGEVDKAIEQAALNAGAFGQKIYTAMQLARSARRTQAEFFNEELIGPLLEKAAPEQVAASFFADNNPTQIRKLYDIVHEPSFRQYLNGTPEEYWQKIQGAAMTMKRIELGEAGVTPGRFKELDGKAWGDWMDQSKESFEALYPDKAQRTNVRRSARALEMTQSTAGSRTGTVLAQMVGGRTIGGAVSQLGNLVTLGAIGAAKGDLSKSALILMVPHIAAKAWASPHFSNWYMQKALTREFRWSSNAGSVVAQGANALIKDRIPFWLYDPATDTLTTHDPDTGTTGPYAPTGNKPVSKIRPQL